MVHMDPYVVIAFIGAVPSTIAAIAALQSSRRSKGVHDEIRTNHGLRQGDYVELTAMVVGELKDWSTQHAADDKHSFAVLSAGQEEIRAEQARVAAALSRAIEEKP